MDPITRKVAVTGATGFLGSHLVKGLLRAGAEVLVLARRTSSWERLSDVKHRFPVFLADRDGIEALFREHAPIDAVVHTAVDYGRDGGSYGRLLDANVRFPLHLLETAADYGAGAFINTDTFFTDAPVQPDYLPGYTMTKKHFAEWGKLAADCGRIRFINVKLEHVYGPDDAPDKFTSDVIRSCLSNVPELPLSPGRQQRDFLYIDDAVEGYLTLLRRLPELKHGYSAYSLGTGVATTIRSFVERAHAIAGSSTVLRFGAVPYRRQEIMRSQGDPRALEQLGWSCKTDLDEGIRNVIRAMEASGQQG